MWITIRAIQILHRNYQEQSKTYQEAETKYNLAKFVINYESYDWQTIQEMLDTVNVMSNNKVFSQYNTAIRADNSR
nr:type IV secretion system protein [Escherichia coli]